MILYIAICETSSGGEDELTIAAALNGTSIISLWFSGASLALPLRR